MASLDPEMESSPDARSVQDRLVEAGEDLFCQRGFNETSVRDIAAAADCNVASINYYFGSKDKLYVEIWRRRLTLIRDARLVSIEKVMSSAAPPPLESLLVSYAGAFLAPMVEGGPACRFASLTLREMMDPHLPPTMFLDEMVLPVMSAFGQALQGICPWLTETEARHSMLSIAGQLIHIVVAKEAFERGERSGPFQLELEEMMNHVIKFSAAGIRAYNEGRGNCE